MVGSDVREDVNKTTLGLYSFRIFVDCVWSAKTVASVKLPSGPRPLLTAGHSNRKRPLSNAIERTGAPKKLRIHIVDQDENAEVVECITTRSGCKLNK